jgi:hypothetical protein
MWPRRGAFHMPKCSISGLLDWVVVVHGFCRPQRAAGGREGPQAALGTGTADKEWKGNGISQRSGLFSTNFVCSASLGAGHGV